MVDSHGDIVLEPSQEQAKDARAQLTFVFDGREKNLVTSEYEYIWHLFYVYVMSFLPCFGLLFRYFNVSLALKSK